MALRIGAILLASANLISGSLIGTGTVIESSHQHHGVTYYTGDTPEPFPVSGIVVNTHVTGDADMDCGSIGC